MTLGHVALVGAMGSGKTTIGVLLASRLRRPFLDNDVELERRAGRTPTAIARDDGIETLHRQEVEVLRSLLADRTPAVITAAASTITDPSVRHALSEALLVILLRAQSDDLVDRLHAPGGRPDFDQPPAELVARQAEERTALFAEVADADFDTSSASPEDVVERICALPDLSRVHEGRRRR